VSKGEPNSPKPKPHSLNRSGASRRVEGLRVIHHKSNFIQLRIPLEIHNSPRGEKALSIAEGSLCSLLPISPAGIAGLWDYCLLQLPLPQPAKRQPIDYGALRQTYRAMLTEGRLSSQAELARHLSVSRVWVSRVLKGMTRKAS